MAYVPGFLHDVFISYACADDQQDGLIRHFYTLLTNALAAKGLKIKEPGNDEGVEVFLDNRNIKSGDDLTEQVLTSARSAAVFFAIYSPAYLSSEWCKQEAREFTANYDPRFPKLEGRLFVIALNRESDPRKSELVGLRSRLFRPFYYLHENGRDFPFDPQDPARQNPRGCTLREEALQMAEEVAETLRKMRQESAAPRVFIAETSPAREAHADDIKRWLLQQQMLVLRASGRGPDWEEESRTLIGQADLFIDLYEAEPTPASLRQAKIATELGKKRVRWLPRDSQLSAAASQTAMQETQVIEETLESFKAALPPLLVQPGERHKPAAAPLPGIAGQSALLDAMVLLVGANNDEACLVQIEKKLDALGCGRDALLTDDVIENPDEWRSRMLQMLEFHHPTSVIFVDGKCAGKWRDVRLRDLLMLVGEAAPYARPALCIFPPPEKPDRRLNPRASQVARIDSQQLDRLQDFLGAGT